MSWFGRYMDKWSQGRDGFDDYLRSSIPEPNWMERLPNGMYYWQFSLDQAMRNGQSEFGPEWEDASPYSQQTGLESDRFSNKRLVFFDWLEKVPPAIVHALKNMIDDHLEMNEEFRPFGTVKEVNNESEPDVEPWSQEELEQWMS